MEVSVKLYASLQTGKESRLSARLSEPAVVADLLQELNLAQHDVEIIAVNGSLSRFDTPLRHGDKVSLTPFIGGG